MAFAKRKFPILLAALTIALAFWLAIFPPVTPRIFLNLRRAMGAIQNLNLAEQEYAARHPDAGFACNLHDLVEQGSGGPYRAALVDSVLASGTKSSYRFYIRCAQRGSKKNDGYTITAIPIEPGINSKYILCSDQTGEIWNSKSRVASDCLATHKPIEQKYR